MPSQLKRLFLLGVVVVSLFLILKYILTPASFGQYGHYRGDALGEIATHQVKYMGSKTCEECHDSIVTIKNGGYHSDIQCEACHGPAYKHNKTPKKEKLIKPDSREFCAKCHSMNKARPEKAITQQDIKEHHKGKKCVECHNPHEP
jgi:predicted CXXCH cytochrome family protein